MMRQWLGSRLNCTSTTAIRFLPALSLLLLALTAIFISARTWPDEAELGRTSSVLLEYQQPLDDRHSNTYGGRQSLVHDVRNRTLGFHEIFLINLPDRTDRLDAMTLMSRLSGFDFKRRDGVKGDTVPDKARPGLIDEELRPGEVGCWRAHLNTIQEIVHRNISSALIMEDDGDWDVRLKDLLFNFALSSNAIQEAHNPDDVLVRSGATEAKFESLQVPFPKISPYGDDWDLLWLGHCGASFKLHKPYVRQLNDTSVPKLKHLDAWLRGGGRLGDFPNHSRLVGETLATACTSAYAVSQSGARKILFELGMVKFDAPIDLMLNQVCDDGRLKCLFPMPQLIQRYRPAGLISSHSDIKIAEGNEILDKGFTQFIRWSVRLNLRKLIDGDTEYEDQWPD